MKNDNFASSHPFVSKEWNIRKNGNLLPESIRSASKRSVWWKCKEGHEWEARVYLRSKGLGKCPICPGRKLSEVNNLKAKHDEIAREWHPSRNGNLKPEKFTSGSSKKIWWKCENNHEWKTSISNRTYGTRCPFCIGAKATSESNLSVLFPSLMKEWDYSKNNIQPYELRPKSGKKVWWKCKYGHEWETSPQKRTGEGTSCPFCSTQTSSIEIRVYCELKWIFNSVIWRYKIEGIECDIFFTKYNIGIEVDGKRWHLNKLEKDIEKFEKLSELGINLIRVREKGLPSTNENDVFFSANTISVENILEILDKIKNISLLEKKDFFNYSVYLEKQAFQNETEYRKILSHLPAPVPEDSLEYNNPEIADLWDHVKNHPLKPSFFSPGSNKKVWWKCVKGHQWNASISNRVKGRGCPHCSNRIITKENSLLTLNPELAKEWNFQKNGKLTPDLFSTKSGQKVWWLCHLGHEWETDIYSRTIGTGCPICAIPKRAKKTLQTKIKKNGSLEETCPELVKEWHPSKNYEITPGDVLKGTNKKVWWLCPIGHEWQAVVSSRSLSGTGCPVCSDKKGRETWSKTILDRSGSFAEKFPEIAKQWNYKKNGDLKPQQVTPHSHKKVWWICKDNHEWQNTPSKRAIGRGCPICRLTKKKTLAEKFPEIAKEWNYERNIGLQPSLVTHASVKKVWWKCKEGHEWEAKICSRSGSKRCPKCANKQRIETRIANKLKKGLSLQDRFPDVAKQWHNGKNNKLKPDLVTARSHKRVWWICTNGHEWEAPVNNRTGGRGCPICYKEKRKIKT